MERVANFRRCSTERCFGSGHPAHLRSCPAPVRGTVLQKGVLLIGFSDQLHTSSLYLVTSNASYVNIRSAVPGLLGHAQHSRACVQAQAHQVRLPTSMRPPFLHIKDILYSLSSQFSADA